MAEEPDRLRADIEGTRAALTRDVDLLAEKTNPKQVARRRWTAVKERVMGTTDEAAHGVHSAGSRIGDAASSVGGAASSAASSVGSAASSAASSVGDAASSAAGAVRGAPQTVKAKAQGNPIAAGIIAFGVGMLAATLLPETEAERRGAQQLRDRGGDLLEGAKDVAREVKDDLADSARQAAGEVKETARDAARQTGDQARTSAQEAAEQTRQAAHRG